MYFFILFIFLSCLIYYLWTNSDYKSQKSPYTGIVQTVYIREGSHVNCGTTLAVVRLQNGQMKAITSQTNGDVKSVKVKINSKISNGDTIAVVYETAEYHSPKKSTEFQYDKQEDTEQIGESIINVFSFFLAIFFLFIKIGFIVACLYGGPPGWITLLVVALLIKS